MEQRRAALIELKALFEEGLIGQGVYTQRQSAILSAALQPSATRSRTGLKRKVLRQVERRGVSSTTSAAIQKNGRQGTEHQWEHQWE